jgi:WD40 repeat protein
VLALTPDGVTEGGASALAWSPSGNELAALEGDFGRRIFIYSGSGRPIAKFKPPASGLDVFGVTLSPDGGHLLLTVGNHRGGPYWKLYQVNPSGKHWQRLPLKASSPPTSWR